MLCFMIKICHIVENKNYVKKEKKINNTARFEHWLQELPSQQCYCYYTMN